MPQHYVKCPFSKMGCRECSIYRGRHCYINSLGDMGRKTGAMNRTKTEWIAEFNDFFGKVNGLFRESIKSYDCEE